jgi:hypothetical protein
MARRQRWLAWSLCGLALAAVAGCAVVDVLAGGRLRSLDGFQPIGLVHGVAFTLLGTLIVLRRPENSIGWICLLIGVTQPVQSLGALYYEYSVVSGRLPGERWVAWLTNLAILPVFPAGLVLFAFLLFPSGRLPSRRWRPIAVAAIALTGVLLVLTLVDPATTQIASGFPRVANVTGVAALGTAVHRIVGFGWLLGAGLLALVIGGLVRRGRHAATRDERQQVKLIAYAAALTVVPLFALAALSLVVGVSNNAYDVPLVLGFGIAVPAAFGFAILKRGLYEIDRVISRTLSYALLTGTLIGIFVGLVLLTTRVLPFASPVGVAASTLLAAGLFTPLRTRLQRAVDRRFNRAHYDAEATVAAFGARLRDSVDVETVLLELTAAATGSLQPAHVTVWVRNDSGT